jgi:hypothetical protein
MWQLGIFLFLFSNDGWRIEINEGSGWLVRFISVW